MQHIEIYNYHDKPVKFGGLRFVPGENQVDLRSFQLALRKAGGAKAMKEALGNGPKIDVKPEVVAAPIPETVPVGHFERLGDYVLHVERWTVEELQAMPFKELKEVATQHGIKGRSKMDLINSLEGNLK